MRTLFDSTQSQESKSEVDVRNRTRQCALGPVLGLYNVKSLPRSDIETTKRKLLSCEAELQSKQNKDLTNLRREVAKEKVMTRKLTFKVFFSSGPQPDSDRECSG